MSAYEKNEERLRALWQELMSDEENEKSGPLENNGTSDEYQPSSNDSDSSESCEPPPRKKQTRKEIGEVSLSENIANRPIINERGSYEWYPADGKALKTFSFTEESSGFQSRLYGLYNKEAVDFFRLFVNNDILDLIVLETNRYASQCVQKDSLPHSRIQKWTPTDRDEIEKLLGIIIWMGLCPFPSMQSYWKKNTIYPNCLPSIISRNRFQVLLKMLHFNNNENLTEDRLQKLSPLIEKLRESFQQPIIPSEYVCIDETLVPFRGRLKFRQYIANKRHKFGIKLFKLCLEYGYTYDFKVYCGKSKDENVSVPSKVVMDLMEKLLDQGRTLCTDNYYKSVNVKRI
ncbi:PREDICTED: piggyBac transposable element-derived protein 4-like [Rhagoletis zephyria]|uniref:piggyBac transposable element-derived protein 4-like n=1 Tax=Rhagoletis zephyria TaxID=28612 RepID=UPI0008119DF4|nr:PREDICTED: piggyBac transposable element-derived protein 4-like [Rhagoletis zephyria]